MRAITTALSTAARLAGWVSAWAVVVALVAGYVAPASAQAPSREPVVEDAASKWLSCLTPAARDLPPPEYPAPWASLNRGATVKVRLRFKNATSAPQLDFFYNDSSAKPFEAAIEQRVSAYRLPCMPPDAEPVEVTEVFRFVPGDMKRVVTGPALHDAPVQRCHYVAGRDTLPSYPSLRYAPSGASTWAVVLMEMTFSDKKSEPSLRLLHASPRAERFVSEVTRHLKGYRLDCDPPYRPVTVKQVFKFGLEGQASYAFGRLTLKEFVSGLDKLEDQRVKFDLSTMGCPFDVLLTLYQPHAPNGVEELDRADPARREFLDWLKSVSLKLPRDMRDRLLGTHVTVGVPCGVLDLTS